MNETLIAITIVSLNRYNNMDRRLYDHHGDYYGLLYVLYYMMTRVIFVAASNLIKVISIFQHTHTHTHTHTVKESETKSMSVQSHMDHSSMERYRTKTVTTTANQLTSSYATNGVSK